MDGQGLRLDYLYERIEHCISSHTGGIITRSDLKKGYSMRHSFPIEEGLLNKVLDYLVKNKRVIRLLPEGMSFERAGEANTYYILSQERVKEIYREGAESFSEAMGRLSQ